MDAVKDLMGYGLSPRMRGNPPVLAAITSIRRSIPAYAGEPLGPRLPVPCIAVYPRVCGGTNPFR